MSDLNAKIVADLKRELAEARAELAQERERANSGDWVEKAHAETLDASCKELESELEAARAEIEQQRTRAEAAESELRESSRQREIEKRVLWSAWEWFDDHDDRKTSAEIYHELQQVVGA